MNVTATRDRIGYFGKIPSRSDFIKLAPDAGFMAVLDDWLAEVMSRLPEDPRWKIHYDAMAPVSFAFVGQRRRHAVAGHIVASRDQSGRRYPFLMMRTLALADPAAFVSHCPLALAPLHAFFSTTGPKLQGTEDQAAVLQEVADTTLALEENCRGALDTFLATGTIGSLAGLLGRSDVRRLVLGLGLLLQPVMHSGGADIEKSLVLPLPKEYAARAAVAAFWMELIAPFLRQANLDLVLFTTRLHGRSVLVVGFLDACVACLHAIIDPIIGREQQVTFADTGWVEEQVAADAGVRALSSYLDQPKLPLSVVRERFLDTFIGAAK
ncbi:type VI secretion system-associated protein TagF [Massilia sp. R2A-15]|uniref:type VI secretion system-associated protein TagF n=1 Tax=Massilia sp. R2A-15 TaxID=3064278 RepID=UPI0027349386|nr:type VI secretion system-associated protein TagF [Massilia sp. R2A-15]WLI90691.1 type VI secretion system-associated protein TagF [Massilia sp. R2A-15]